MELVDPIEEAANEYLDNLLVLPLEPPARRRVLEILRQRDQKESPARTNVETAKRNAIRLIRDAEGFARSRSQSTVDEAAVAQAFLKLCPGLYPFC